MHRPALRLISFLTLTSVLPAAAQLPAGWRVVSDTPVPDSMHAYGPMAPGWHLTAKGPGALVYDPAWTTGARYALEWDAFVFAATSTEPFGVFFGARELEGNAASLYAVVMNLQGQFAVFHRAGPETHMIVPPARNADLALPPPNDAARNVLRVAVEPDSVRVSVNGKWAASFATPGDLSGTFGFRMGSGANLHVARLDVTTPLAPPRAPRRSTN